MSRILSQTLIRDPQTLMLITRLSLPSFFLGSRRAKSSRSEKAELIEIDLGPEPEPGSEAEAEIEVGVRRLEDTIQPEPGSGSKSEVEIEMGVRRLEDAIHKIIAKKSRPDWIPFIPGSSYWVPPKGKRAMGVVELVGRVSPPLSKEETMSLTTLRGWPSSAYFIDGALPHPVKKRSSWKGAAQSDDEE